MIVDEIQKERNVVASVRRTLNLFAIARQSARENLAFIAVVFNESLNHDHLDFVKSNTETSEMTSTSGMATRNQRIYLVHLK